MIKAKCLKLIFLIYAVFFFNKAISQEIKALQKGGWIVAGSFNFNSNYTPQRTKLFNNLKFELNGSTGYFFRDDYVVGLNVSNINFSNSAIFIDTRRFRLDAILNVGPFVRVYSDICKDGKVFIGGDIHFNQLKSTNPAINNGNKLIAVGLFQGGFVYFINEQIGIQNSVCYTTYILQRNANFAYFTLDVSLLMYLNKRKKD